MTSSTSKPDVNPVLGVVAVVSACEWRYDVSTCNSNTFRSGLLSGLAGAYFEKILKSSPVSVWTRNIQLGIFGIFFSSITVLVSDRKQIDSNGFFYGYTPLVWLAIFTQSAGGLLVAVVVKYADTILKGFATSAAIVLSCLISMLLFEFHLTFLFALGAALVILSIFLYSKPDLILRIPLLNMFLKDRSVLL
jgi:UDP-galactose transporter